MTKKSKIIVMAVSAIVFLSAFTLATFYDFQISGAIARLTAGKYLSENAFGKFFETVGEMPMYIAGGFATANLLRASLCVKNNKLKYVLSILSFIAGVAIYYAMLIRATEYVFEHANALDKFEEFGLVIDLCTVAVGVGATLLTAFLAFKIPKKHLKALVVFSIAVIVSAFVGQGFVQAVKSVVGRQRFRAIKVLDYYGRNDLIDYSKWFVINGKRSVTEEMLALGIATDGYKSFPSGHVCCWTYVFVVAFLPDFLGLEENKRVKVKGILLVLATLTTLLLAYTRILVGAHYATDVLFSACWTYFVIAICCYFAKKILNKINEKHE